MGEVISGSNNRAYLMMLGRRQVDADQLTKDPEAQPCQKPPIVLFQPYRVGGGKRMPHWAHRWHVDRWFRSWQCEWELIYGTTADHCMAACRAWTKAGVLRKANRWFRTGRDVGRHRTCRPWVDKRRKAADDLTTLWDDSDYFAERLEAPRG